MYLLFHGVFAQAELLAEGSLAGRGLFARQELRKQFEAPAFVTLRVIFFQPRPGTGEEVERPTAVVDQIRVHRVGWLVSVALLSGHLVEGQGPFAATALLRPDSIEFVCEKALESCDKKPAEASTLSVR